MSDVTILRYFEFRDRLVGAAEIDPRGSTTCGLPEMVAASALSESWKSAKFLCRFGSRLGESRFKLMAGNLLAASAESLVRPL